MALDYGTKRIGIAVGQAITRTATPVGVVSSGCGETSWQALDQQVQSWQPDAFVLGLPLDREGERQEMTELAEAFAQQLEARYQLKIFWMDERYSSQEANARLKALSEGGKKKSSKAKQAKKRQEQNKDSIAAAIILETWFNEHSVT